MRYLFLLLIVAFASCEKPQLNEDEWDQHMMEDVIVEPTAPATSTVVEPTQPATSTQATETTQTATTTTPTETTTQPVSNGFSAHINGFYSAGAIVGTEGNGQIDVIIPDGQGFGNDEHGARMIINAQNETNNATYHKLLGSMEIAMRHAIELESDNTQIIASATDNNALAAGNDVDADIKHAVSLLSEDILYLDALENTTFNYNQATNSTSYYSEDEVYGLHGDAAHHIGETKIGLEFTVFVAGVKRSGGDYYLSLADYFLNDFEGHIVYVETEAGDSSMGTGRLAGIAAEFAAEGLTASEIKAEILAMGETTTLLKSGLMTDGVTEYTEIELTVIRL